MGGFQIERLLEQIDTNIDLARDEAIDYIKEHQSELARELVTNGKAVIRTDAGMIEIRLEDLAAAAAL